MFKTPNQNPTDVFREHMQLNQGSFSATNAESDDFRQVSQVSATPTRTTLLPDGTAYGTAPTADGWTMRLHGAGSPANTKALNQGGQLT